MQELCLKACGLVYGLLGSNDENNRIIAITRMIIKNAGKMRRIQERPCALKPQWISLGFINVTKKRQEKENRSAYIRVGLIARCHLVVI